MVCVCWKRIKSGYLQSGCNLCKSVCVCIDEVSQWIAKVPSTILLHISSLSSLPNFSFHLLPLKMSAQTVSLSYFPLNVRPSFHLPLHPHLMIPCPNPISFQTFLFLFFASDSRSWESFFCFSCFSLWITNKVCNRSLVIPTLNETISMYSWRDLSLKR